MTGVASRTLLLLAVPLSGCTWFRAPAPPPPPAKVEIIEDPVPIDWQSVVTPADKDRLARLDEAWRQGLAAAARYRTAIRQEGALLDPAVALPRAAPSPGTYRCRIVRLGGRPAFTAFKTWDCYVEVEGELLTMSKATGTQRPAGRLWPDGDTRMIFLGALSSDGDAPPPYASDATRDIAGRLERIGPFRWRLAVPFPQDGALLDVYELVPYVPPAS